MTANPLKGALTERITAPQDQQTRVEFWIARGNDLLAAQGRRDLQWRWANGSYFIESRNR